MSLKFIIEGVPQAKQSVKFTRTGKAYTPQSKRMAQEYLSMCIAAQLPRSFRMLEGGIIVIRLLYVFPLLKSLNKAEKEMVRRGGYLLKTTEPDLADNLNKMLFDAMQGVVYYNDAQVCQIFSLLKVYGEKPRTEIELKEMCRAEKHVFL